MNKKPDDTHTTYAYRQATATSPKASECSLLRTNKCFTFKLLHKLLLIFSML